MEDETLICLGDEIKATKLENGSVKLGGYLVRYSTENDPDLTGDFFTKNTDFGNASRSTSWFHHRAPLSFEGKSAQYKNELPEAKLTKDEIGVFAEIVLSARNAYEEAIGEMGLSGKLAWSSGTAPHLVDRKKVGKSYEITKWRLGLDASLTPTPAEPRNGVLPLKSLLTPSDAVHDGDKENTNKELDMETEELKSLLKENSEEIATKSAELAKKAADEAVKSALEEFSKTLPEIKAGYQVEVVTDETDNKLKGEPMEGAKFFQEVKNASNGYASKELKAYVKTAQGLNEAIPSDGGFLLPQAETGAMLERMYDVGQILSRVQKDSVAGNAMNIPAVDETSRATGSRQGGVRGYWLEEAGTKTKSKPKFREISLKLKKVAALVYATDEMLEDVNFMTSWINRTVPDELRFLTEDAIYNGDGVGKPLGIMSSPALVSAVRTDANLIAFADIVGMWARRWGGVSDYVWLINQDVGPQLDQLFLATGTAGIPPRFVDYDAQGIMRMKGAPVLEVEYAQTLGTLGDILLTSLSQYQAIDKASGIQAASSIHVRFVNDESAFRFVYRVDGEPTWNSALTPFKGTNTQSPYVALAATT